MTGAEALRAAAARLRGAGVEDAADDARTLLAHALGIGRGALPARLGEPLADAARARFGAAIEARARRQPVAQITGRRRFWRHAFRVTPAVLDPRPETELLVELGLAEPFGRVADLGTGSGCILLSLLAEMPSATGLGTDVDEAALAVAAANAAELGLAPRAEFRRADWWAGVEGRFDLVVSNPPYVSAEEHAALAPEVRDWEPRHALTPGGDGLDAYRAIAAGAAAHLRPGGRLLLEIGPTQAESVADLLAAGGLPGAALHRDLDGRPRVLAARLSA